MLDRSVSLHQLLEALLTVEGLVGVAVELEISVYFNMIVSVLAEVA